EQRRRGHKREIGDGGALQQRRLATPTESKPAQRQDQGKAKESLARTGQRLLLPEQAAQPQADLQALGLAEQYFFALELLDRPVQRQAAVKDDWRQDRHKVEPGHLVQRDRHQPLHQQSDTGHRHQAIKRIQFYSRRERQEDQRHGDDKKRHQVILALLGAARVRTHRQAERAEKGR